MFFIKPMGYNEFTLRKGVLRHVTIGKIKLEVGKVVQS